MKFFCEKGHFGNILNIQITQYPLLMFSLDSGEGYAQGSDQE